MVKLIFRRSKLTFVRFYRTNKILFFLSHGVIVLGIVPYFLLGNISGTAKDLPKNCHIVRSNEVRTAFICIRRDGSLKKLVLPANVAQSLAPTRTSGGSTKTTPARSSANPTTGAPTTGTPITGAPAPVGSTSSAAAVSFEPLTASTECAVHGPVAISDKAGIKKGRINTVLATHRQLADEGTEVTYQNNQSGSFFTYLFAEPNLLRWDGATHVGFILKNPTNQPMQIAFDVASKTSPGVGGRSTNADIVLAANKTYHIALQIPARTGSTFDPANGYYAFKNILPAVGLRGQVPEVFSFGSFAGQVEYINIKARNPFSTWSNKLIVQHVYKICAPNNRNYTGLLDKYGQLSYINHQDKVTSDDQLRADAQKPAPSPQLPLDQYFAPLENPIIAPASDRYSVVKHAGRWVLVNPNGREFHSIGAAGVGMTGGQRTVISQREQLFQELPPTNHPLIGTSYSTRSTFVGPSTLSFDHFRFNLAKKYNRANPHTEFSEQASKQLLSWGFNTCGAHCQTELSQSKKLLDLPWFEITGSHRRISNLPVTYWGAMHDVFDPQFQTSITTSFNQNLPALIAAKSHNVGVYIDNELSWADGRSARNKYNIPIGVLNSAADQPSKVEFINRLKTKYGASDTTGISALNAAWGTSFANWNALANTPYSAPATLPAGMVTDFSDFLSAFAQRYFSSVRTKLNEFNYTGLYMGCRYIERSFTDEILAANRQYADIISVNIYDGNPTRLHPDLAVMDFPIMVSEFSFNSPFGTKKIGGAYLTAMDQDAEKASLNAYYDVLKGWKNIVGLQWFAYIDHSAAGRYTDAENHGFGLVDITDRPHQATADAVKANNLKVHQQW